MLRVPPRYAAGDGSAVRIMWREPDDLTGNPVIDAYIASAKDVPKPKPAHARPLTTTLPARPVVLTLAPAVACEVLAAIEARRDLLASADYESPGAAKLIDVEREMRTQMQLRVELVERAG